MGPKVVSLRARIWLGIALAHLSLVSISSFSLLELFPDSFGGKLLPLYGEATGSGNTYGFFAPGIFNQLRVTFDLVNEKGKKHKAALETGASHEADLRVGNIIDQFISESDSDISDEELQRSLAASLARVFFMRFPDTRQVKVQLENYEPMSMKQYKSGQRAKWEPIYQATFSHQHRPSQL